MEQQTGKPAGKMPWVAYAVITRNDKTFWNRVGNAFVNRDGSWNVYLDSVPLDGKIQLREYAGSTKLGGVLSPGVVLCPDWQMVMVDYVTVAAGSNLDLQVLDSPLNSNEAFYADDITLFNTTPLVGVAVDSIPDLGSRIPLVAKVAPSPLRTVSTLSFVTSRPGPLRVTLFNTDHTACRSSAEFFLISWKV